MAGGLGTAALVVGILALGSNPIGWGVAAFGVGGAFVGSFGGGVLAGGSSDACSDPSDQGDNGQSNADQGDNGQSNADEGDNGQSNVDEGNVDPGGQEGNGDDDGGVCNYAPMIITVAAGAYLVGSKDSQELRDRVVIFSAALTGTALGLLALRSRTQLGRALARLR